MSTQATFNRAEFKPLLQQLDAARKKSKAEERTALKKKMRCTMESRKSGWRDTSGNEDLITAARRGLIREHIAKVAIMEQMGLEDIPTFADVWANYLESNTANNQPKKKCITSNCECESSH
jgi:hypothetical protein